MPLVVLLALTLGVQLIARLFVPAAAAGGDAQAFLRRVQKDPKPAALRTPVSTAYQEEAMIRRVLYGEGAAYD